MTNNNARKKIRVGILFGGKSGEHEVSLTSAKNVMDAIDQSKYEVVPIGITKQGLWLSGPDVHRRLTEQTEPAPQLAAHIANKAAERALTPFLDDSVATQNAPMGSVDVILPILHGPMGEDGTVQGFLELANLPYVGCGVLGSAAAMDKAMAKAVFRANGLPVTADVLVLRHEWQSAPAETVAKIEATLRYPLFIKPANMGSSVGVTKAHHRAELEAGLNLAARFDRRLLVEQGIKNAREIEVAVLGNNAPIASEPGEVIPSREFYSYASKYIDDNSGLLIPAPLKQGQTARVREMALTAFKALDCAGLARVDFLLEEPEGVFYLNEINTMPGFTAISMYPKLWQAGGISYTELIDRLIELAFERYADKQQNAASFNVSEAE